MANLVSVDRLEAGMLKAAGEGDTNAMMFLKANGVSNHYDALTEAAAGGHLKAMKLLKEWIEPTVESIPMDSCDVPT